MAVTRAGGGPWREERAASPGPVRDTTITGKDEWWPTRAAAGHRVPCHRREEQMCVPDRDTEAGVQKKVPPTMRRRLHGDSVVAPRILPTCQPHGPAAARSDGDVDREVSCGGREERVEWEDGRGCRWRGAGPGRRRLFFLFFLPSIFDLFLSFLLQPTPGGECQLNQRRRST
jgi:hypothetical protein